MVTGSKNPPALAMGSVKVEEIMSFIDIYQKERMTVNMNRFIKETPDDILKEVSGYYIEGFNWTGTKFEIK